MNWGVEGLTVQFGPVTALAAVELDVAAGEVTAVVGGDGAGKSTLLRVLAGVPVPFAGVVRRPPPTAIGFVPSGAGVYPDLSVDENIEFVARAFGIGSYRDRLQPLLRQTALVGVGSRLAGRLSGGQRRKLAVLLALLHRPQLLVLDEPTTGLDPVSRVELWQMMGRAAAAGAAVVMSTSYLDEAERAAEVLVLHEGRPRQAGSPDEVIAAMPGIVVETETPRNPTRAWPAGSRWREWFPEGGTAGSEPSFEDAVMVAALAAEEAQA